jgi:uncharacterized protein (TIGR00266 family)
MKAKIRGDLLPILDVELSKGESMFTETGGMAWMSSNISMETNAKGGIMQSIGRAFAHESIFMTTYTCDEGTGIISFCSEFPGKIVKHVLKQGESLICQKDAFMAGTTGINVKAEFVKKLGAAFFGGEGFFLQRVMGPGTVYLEFPGEMTEYTLKPGQRLKVDPGYIGAFEPSVKYDIARVKGIKNIFLSGEGLFVASLEGPGKIWLQSMPLSNLAKKIYPYLPKKKNK